MNYSGKPRFRFGVFEANPNSGELWKNGRLVSIQDLPFRVLTALLEHPGEMVGREDLHKMLWPADTTVVFDQGLNTAVKKLRGTLRDSATNPVFIETLPKKGYRFIAPVTIVEHVPAPAHAPPRMWNRRWMLACSVALVLLGVAIGVWIVQERSEQVLVSPVPLTSYTGVETEPSFSPDGRQVAFSWNGERESNFDIYVREVGSEKLVRLTTNPNRDFGPAWSPDGRLIAFGREQSAYRTEIFITPATSNSEVKVTDVYTPHLALTCQFMAWTPDGKWLVVSDEDSAAKQNGVASPTADAFSAQSLFLVSIETGERRRLTARPQGEIDSCPAFSPDGATLAFVRRKIPWVNELYSVPLSREYAPAGPEKQLTSDQRLTTAPAWTPDGTEIVFSAGVPNSFRLWSIPIEGQRAETRLEFAGDWATYPTISRQGSLAYAKESIDENVWRLELSAPGVAASAGTKFLSSTRIDTNPHFSPDGKRVIFGSNRSGQTEIWAANADGTNAAPLTNMRAQVTGGSNWSADGSRVLFDSNREGQFEIYTVSAAGGAPKRLTRDPATDGVPSSSEDGAWIYFMSNRSGSQQIWKIPSRGGAAVQLTRNGGYVAVESPDRRFIYFSKTASRPGGLWRMPVGGGEEVEVLPSVTFLNVAIAREGIYFVPTANGRSAIHFLDFATGKDSRVVDLTAEPGYGLTISPNGKTLLYTQIDNRGSDLMLVEKFR